MVGLCVVVCSALTLTGCGKSAPPPEEVVAEEESPAEETRPAEGTIEVELEDIPDIEELSEEPVEETPAPPEPEPAEEPEPQIVYGYRVQVFASSTEQGAEKAAAAAREVFSEPIYIEYVAPLYKVRVGDCFSRGEADALKKKAISLGYRDAWIVESLVERKY
jgi:hypothetical protein